MANTKSQSPHAAIQMMCTWSAVIGIVLFFFAIFLAGFIPLPSPSLTQDQVVAMYQGNTNNIRIGMELMMASGMFLMPMVGVISVQLKRIEGTHTALANTQLCAGAINIVFFVLTGLVFLITAFRPDRSPELTYLMNDASWFTLVLVWPPASMQLVATGLAILNDKSEQPIFPRWAGFLNIWVAVLFLPASIVPFFKTGPFAWNGLLGWWLPVGVYGVWFVVMVPLLMKAVKRQALEASA